MPVWLMWSVPAACGTAVLGGLAVRLWRLARLTIRGRLSRHQALMWAGLHLLRLAVLVAGAVSVDLLLTTTVPHVLPGPPSTSGLLGRWALQIVVSGLFLALWEAGPAPMLSRVVAGK